MTFSISHLRRWLGLAAILAIAGVAGAYFHTLHRLQNVLKQVPEKMGIEFKQTANGFSMSKSELGRTIFRIEASKAVQYKAGGRAELHDVQITLYGRESNRFDRIYGKDFIYDQQTGDVTSQGEVDMDLESNPSGVTSPDQASPKEQKNPIHLKTRSLIFNQKTGDAHTAERVDFSVPQASGSSIGMEYEARTSLLTLMSQVDIRVDGRPPTAIKADRGSISKDPHVVLLERARVVTGSEQSEADHETLFLRPDNSVERVLARGNARVQYNGQQVAKVRSDQMDVLMAPESGTQGEGTGAQPEGESVHRTSVRKAFLTGNVQFESLGPGPMQGNSQRATVDFGKDNSPETIHAEGNVKLVQHQASTGGAAGASRSGQDFELTAPVVDFFLVDGKRFERAETTGPPQIILRPAPQPSTGGTAGQQTVITSSKFEAKFDDLGQLSSVHGEPETRVVNTAPGQPDRVSTSHTLDAAFVPGTGIQTLFQRGAFVYVDGEHSSWADQARYTPADQILLLTGSPRIADKQMTTTARQIRMNRSTGDGLAQGEVKTTYNDLKPNPQGGFLSSSSPIHVTAASMTAHRSPAVALYTGDARLWQDDNLVEAPEIEFDRDQRTMTAQSSPRQQILTVLVQTDKTGKVTPVRTTSQHLTYADSERKAHFEGDVVAKGEDITIASERMDVFLQAKSQAPVSPSLTSASKLDRIIAWDQVRLNQPGRRGTGERLVYTAADDKFVLTGGPPSIFDAERGKVTGVSLTMFRSDDRVLVEGSDKSLAVTQTRVAR
jgi:lipopolysaccharide export system protein LptA